MKSDKIRLDQALVLQKLVPSRSQAESWVRLGKVTVDGKPATKPGQFVRPDVRLELTATEQYVSRAGLKLASVAQLLGLDFKDKIVLDVGSSTGGFTDYALKHGAKKVYAVDVGTDQLHPSLHGHMQIDLYEKTDIRDVFGPLPSLQAQAPARRSLDAGPVAESAPHSKKSQEISLAMGAAPLGATRLSAIPDITVMDVSFISLRDILPHIAGELSGKNTQVVAMLKPQFEAGKHQVNKGVIKNDSVRRQILKDFEAWAKQYFVIQDKRDSDVAGAKGNQERFYLLKTLK